MSARERERERERERDYINDIFIYLLDVHTSISIWIVCSLSCVYCQEREGGPFHCSVIKSSGRATKHIIQPHTHTHTQRERKRERI